jgi:hypothetical protein
MPPKPQTTRDQRIIMTDRSNFKDQYYDQTIVTVNFELHYCDLLEAQSICPTVDARTETQR